MTTPSSVPAHGEAIIEQIAREWDGCTYEALGADIDIGEAIRRTARALVAASPCAAQPTELQRIHEVVMHVGGDWPDDERDPYTLRHVKWMAREINKRTRA